MQCACLRLILFLYFDIFWNLHVVLPPIEELEYLVYAVVKLVLTACSSKLKHVSLVVIYLGVIALRRDRHAFSDLAATEISLLNLIRTHFSLAHSRAYHDG